MLAATLLGSLITSASVYAEPIEEIIVTAQKRAESAQDVPISLQVLSGEQIRQLGILRADDILSHFPNVSTNASNEVNTGFTIRGVGTSNYHGNVARAIGVYQDDVSIPSPFSGVLGVFDMDRVELLRGPQNTLFGRNTTGGAINYISTKPSLEGNQNSFVQATYGRYNTVRGEAGINVGLTEAAAFRISGLFNARDGFFTNRLNGEKLGKQESYSVRGQLLWQLADNTELLFNYHQADNSGTNKGTKAIGLGEPGNPSQPCTDNIGAFDRITDCVIANDFNPSNTDFHDVYLAVSPRQDIKMKGGFIKLSHTFDSDFEITSISSIEKTDVALSKDNGGANVLTFNPMQDATYKQFSQELRLLSPTSGEFRWLLGGLYLEEDLAQATIVRRDVNPAAPAGPGPNAEVISYNLLDQKDRDLSIYGQLEYDLSEDFTVTLGLRYTDNDKSAQSNFGVLVSPIALFSPETFIDRIIINEMINAGASDPRIATVAVPNFTLTPKQNLSELTGKLGFDYRIHTDALIYTSYSRGFKSGGFDTRALAALNGDAGKPVGAEFLDAFELGLKSNPSEALQVNIAAFYYDWQDAQIFSVIGGVPAFTNIPSSRIYGLDADIQWAPDENWLVSLAFGLLNSKITDAGNLGGVTEGHDLSNAPKFSATANVRREISIGDATILLAANARYIDERFEGINAARDFASTKDGVFELGVRADIDLSEQSPLSFSVWADNLTGAQYCIEKRLLDPASRGAVPGLISGAVNCTPSDGKTIFGLTARVQF